jgi:hypothetical protein
VVFFIIQILLHYIYNINIKNIRGCGGSYGDVVAQLGMWWLSGDVVAQLAKARLGEPDCLLLRSSSGFDAGFLHSLLRGGRKNDCVSKIKSQDVRLPFLSKKQTNIINMAFANDHCL